MSRKHGSLRIRFQIFENVSYLVLLQGLNYLLPLATVPYLARVLGVEKFGLIAFAVAMARYFELLSNYGFDLTATKDIARNHDDPGAVSEIFSLVLRIKLVLILAGFILLLILVFGLEKFRGDWEIFLLSYGTVLGNGLFPLWLFLGLEKMKYITLMNLFSRSLLAAGIFLFVRVETDYLLVPLLYSASALLIGVLGIGFAKKHFGVSLVRAGVCKRNPREYLRAGFLNFASNVSSLLFNTSNVFLLGYLKSNTEVAIYSGAERIASGLYSMVVPINNGIYPYISAQASTNREAFRRMFRRTLGIIAILFGGGSALLLVFSRPLARIILGAGFAGSENVLGIFSPLPLFVAINSTINVLFFVSLDMEHVRTSNIVAAGAVNVVLCLLLIPAHSYSGAAVAFVLSQLMLSVLSGIRYLRATKE